MSGANFFLNLFKGNDKQQNENGFSDLMDMMNEVSKKLPTANKNNQNQEQMNSFKPDLKKQEQEQSNQVVDFDINEEDLNDGWGENFSDPEEQDENINEGMRQQNDNIQVDFSDLLK